jgi:hypothetical protein
MRYWWCLFGIELLLPGSFLANDLMHLTNYYDENDPLSKQVFQRDKLVKHFANVASINLSFANGLAGW